jgi:hypothetical protein
MNGVESQIIWQHSEYRSDGKCLDYDAVVLSLAEPGVWRGVLTGPGLSENPIKCSANTRELMIDIVESRLKRQLAAMKALEE